MYIGLGDPDAIREFLGTILEKLRHCDIKSVAPFLLRDKIITNGQYQDIMKVATAGALLYGYLYNDPSNRKLDLLSEVLLKEKVHHRNQALGHGIKDYLLKSYHFVDNGDHETGKAVKIADEANSNAH